MLEEQLRLLYSHISQGLIWYFKGVPKSEFVTLSYRRMGGPVSYKFVIIGSGLRCMMSFSLLSFFKVSLSLLIAFDGCDFLAPTGARGVTISVCLSVRYKFVSSTQSSSFWLKSLSNQSAVSWQSVSSHRAIREQIESTQSIEISVIQSEPKILRLVINNFNKDADLII